MLNMSVHHTDMRYTPVEEIKLVCVLVYEILSCRQLLSYRETAVHVNKTNSSGCLIMSGANL